MHIYYRNGKKNLQKGVKSAIYLSSRFFAVCERHILAYNFGADSYFCINHHSSVISVRLYL